MLLGTHDDYADDVLTHKKGTSSLQASSRQTFIEQYSPLLPKNNDSILIFFDQQTHYGKVRIIVQKVELELFEKFSIDFLGTYT